MASKFKPALLTWSRCCMQMPARPGFGVQCGQSSACDTVALVGAFPQGCFYYWWWESNGCATA
eukprot:14977742-Ditylum_brightwellii.AAC.1